MKGKVVLFCGIPGSGKTTIAGLLADRLAPQVDRVRLLSSDNLRAPVYKRIFRAVSGRDPAEILILDATFFKKELRSEVKARARPDTVLKIYIDCPLEIALQRNRERHPSISEKALRIMFHRMEPPDHPTIRIDAARTSPEAAVAKICDLMKNEMS
ncbi:MAG TPA: adenylyl-sulfate kinase [Candidatus Eisenbacteria bacterium]|nr:adenylyl-sulfate kinase [Candidatus Eisenbacteria bacterium]